jgi:hypothetical protein
MSTTMRRQLERLQSDLDEIKPKPPRTIRLIAKPRAGATATEQATYSEALAWSKAQGGKDVNLIVLVPLEPIRG